MVVPTSIINCVRNNGEPTTTPPEVCRVFDSLLSFFASLAVAVALSMDVPAVIVLVVVVVALVKLAAVVDVACC
jgi:hypothetical protein